MRMLYLTLKAKWFDMIEAGIKKEEYREMKDYWIKRLWTSDHEYDPPKVFDAVCFARGGHFHPSIKQITLKCEGIDIGCGNQDWGAEPGKEYFVIKLGEIINQQ